MFLQEHEDKINEAIFPEEEEEEEEDKKEERVMITHKKNISLK